MLVRKYDCVTPARVGRVTISCWAIARPKEHDIHKSAHKIDLLTVNAMVVVIARCVSQFASLSFELDSFKDVASFFTVLYGASMFGPQPIPPNGRRLVESSYAVKGGMPEQK